MRLLLGTVGLTLLALCARADEFKVSCPESVTAEADTTVILNCHTEPRADLTLDTVVWTIYNSDTWDYDDILLYRQGKQILTKGYEDRASIFIDQLSEGNCSLKLKVKSTDGGRYYGTVTLGGGAFTCSFSLTVRKSEGQNVSPTVPPQTTTQQPDDGGKNNNIGVIVGSVIGVLVVAVVLALGVYLCCKKQGQGGAEGLNEEHLELRGVDVSDAPADCSVRKEHL